MVNVDDVYAAASQMSQEERLRLAARLLSDIVEAQNGGTASNGAWSRADEDALATAALRYAAELYGDEDELLTADESGHSRHV